MPRTVWMDEFDSGSCCQPETLVCKGDILGDSLFQCPTCQRWWAKSEGRYWTRKFDTPVDRRRQRELDESVGTPDEDAVARRVTDEILRDRNERPDDFR